MPRKRKPPSHAESGTDRTRVTEEQQEYAPSEPSNEPSTSGTSTAPSEPTTTSIDLTATINNAVTEGLKAASAAFEALKVANEGFKAAAEALGVKDKPESTTPITLGSLFKQDMIAAKILPYYPNSSKNPPEYLINEKKYPTYYKKAVEKEWHSQLLYPRGMCLIAGNEFPILMDERPSANLMAHWKKWLPQFPEPRFKTIVEGIEDEDQIVTVFPMEKIPEEKHAVDPDKHYHVLLKSAIPDTGVRCPKYFKEDEVFPCMVKVDQSMGGDSNYVAYNKKHLADTLRKFKEDFGKGIPYVITEFVENVEKTLCCQFYLNSKGEVHWLGASLNVLNGYAWVGCKVDWDLNEYYRRRVYDSFITPVANYLHKKRYFGIAGIDIITCPSGDYLVDINARITGCAPHVLIAPEMAREGLTKSLFKKHASHKCSTEELIKKANYANETTDGKILILNSMDVDEGCTAAIVAFGQTMAEVEDLFDCLTDEKQNKEPVSEGLEETTTESENTTEDRKRDAERGAIFVPPKLVPPSFLSEEDGNAPEIFSFLKTRHNAVLETFRSSEIPLEERRRIVRDHFSEICKEKKDTYETVAEADAVTACLKQAARKILNSSSHRIHSIIPYHYHGETAVVIYTYYPTPDLFEKDWSKEFLGFSVFVINLVFGYATDSSVLPKPYPNISPKKQDELNEIKDKLTQQLAEKHSNLSTVAVDYRRKGKKLQEEICLQIGVLTKGILPLGEEEIHLPEIDSKVSLNVVESSATLCFSTGILGVGIGVEGDHSSTGSLGAVVKHKKTGELYLLSNAHVLLRRETFSSIVHPSQEDYEENRRITQNLIETLPKICENLRSRRARRIAGGLSVIREDYFLAQGERDLNRAKEDDKAIALPRTIATVNPGITHFIRQGDFAFGDPPRRYGIDAAIAALIAPDEFEPEDMNEMHQWPSYLRDERGSDVRKIALNGNFKNREEIADLLVSDVVVYKCGRTTGVTRGTLFKEINVRMGGGIMCYNVLHIKSSTVRNEERRDFCTGGDSGAVVFDNEGSCVGLLFARIDTASLAGGGLATPIHVVFDALNIDLASADDLQAMTASGGLKLKE